MPTNPTPNFGNAYVRYFIDKQKKEDEKQKKTNGSASTPAVKPTLSPAQMTALAMPFAPKVTPQETNGYRAKTPRENLPIKTMRHIMEVGLIQIPMLIKSLRTPKLISLMNLPRPSLLRGMRMIQQFTLLMKARGTT